MISTTKKSTKISSLNLLYFYTSGSCYQELLRKQTCRIWKFLTLFTYERLKKICQEFANILIFTSCTCHTYSYKKNALFQLNYLVMFVLSLPLLPQHDYFTCIMLQQFICPNIPYFDSAICTSRCYTCPTWMKFYMIYKSVRKYHCLN